MANYGAKTAQAAELVQQGGQLVPQGVVNVYKDGGAAPVADLQSAAAALPTQAGLIEDDLKFLTQQMIAGQNYAQASAALIAGLPSQLQPSAATLASYQALVTARAAMNPPYYPQ